MRQKIVVASHKKRQEVRSNKWALSQVANNLTITAESSCKPFKMMPEENQRRKEGYTTLEWEEAKKKKNWEHVLCIAEIFARAAQATGYTSTPRGSYLPYQMERPTHPDNHHPYQPSF